MSIPSPSPSPSPTQSRHTVEWALAVMVALLALAIYLPHLNAELLFDDARLTDGTIYGVYGAFDAIRQRFVSYSTFPWMDALLGPGWAKQRIFNLAVHAATVAGLFFLTRELLLKLGGGIQTRLLVLSVGLFALHPVAVYAVGYLIQRSILMATLFTVWALFSVARGLRTGSMMTLAAAVPLYALAVLSKEYAITAVLCVVPLYLYLRRPSLRGAAIGLALLTLAALAAFSFLYPIYKQFLGTAFDERSQAYLRQLEMLQPGISGDIHGLSIANQCLLFFRYGLFWWFPNVMDMSLDLRPAFPLSLTAAAALAGMFGYAMALIASAWCVVRRDGALQLAGLLVMVPLLLFTTEFVLVWVQDPLVLYRSYLWAIAVPGLVYLLATRLLPVRLQMAVLLVLCAMLTALAFERASSLRSAFAAWDDAARKVALDAPPNAVGRWRAFLNRGTELLERGGTAAAIGDFQQAMRLGEPDGSAAMNLGIALQNSRQHAEALGWLEKARAMGYKEPGLFFHLAESQIQLGQPQAAFDNYGRALAAGISPQLTMAIREKRAGSAMAAKRFDIALEDYTALSSAQPNAIKFKVGVNFALINLGRAREAIDALNPLIETQPSAHQALYTRALAFEVLNDKARAIKDMDAALALQPTNPLYQSVRNRLSGAAASRK